MPAPFNNESGNAAVRVSSRPDGGTARPHSRLQPGSPNGAGETPKPATVSPDAVHAELRQIAARFLRNERQGHTLEPHALVNELWIRLMGGEPVSYQNRAHFFAIAAQTMRRILIDHARARIAGKRGGDQQQVSLECRRGLESRGALRGHARPGPGALEAREADPRAARVVELRFFSGLQEDEVAEVLGVSVDHGEARLESRPRLARRPAAAGGMIRAPTNRRYLQCRAQHGARSGGAAHSSGNAANCEPAQTRTDSEEERLC